MALSNPFPHLAVVEVRTGGSSSWSNFVVHAVECHYAKQAEQRGRRADFLLDPKNRWVAEEGRYATAQERLEAFVAVHSVCKVCKPLKRHQAMGEQEG